MDDALSISRKGADILRIPQNMIDDFFLRVKQRQFWRIQNFTTKIAVYRAVHVATLLHSV